MGKLAHRHGDPRVCGATTVVVGQSTVTIDGQLWAVLNDPNSHVKGELNNTTGSSVFINGLPVIVHGPDTARPDTLCLGGGGNNDSAQGYAISGASDTGPGAHSGGSGGGGGGHCVPSTAGGAASTQCYPE